LVSVKDVSAQSLIKEIANDLKVNKKVISPEFAAYVKTGCHRENAPDDPDWWYIRMASVFRRVYISGNVTVTKLRSYYGGKKRRGTRPPKFKRAGGKVIRVCLQELEKLGFVKIIEKKGRAITSEGQKYLDKMATEVSKVVAQETKKSAVKEEKPKVAEVKPAKAEATQEKQ